MLIRIILDSAKKQYSPAVAKSFRYSAGRDSKMERLSAATRCVFLSSIALALLALNPSSGIIAQSSTTGVARGKVVDAEGMAIPNAVVQLTNKKTGLQTAVTTDSGGVFYCPDRESGHYRVKVTYPKYEDDELPDLVITLGQTNEIAPHPPIFSVGLTRIAGLLVSPQNKGKSDTVVTITGVDVKIDKDVRDWDKTDAGGHFTIRYLRPGTYDVKVRGQKKAYTVHIPKEPLVQVFPLTIKLTAAASINRSKDMTKVALKACDDCQTSDQPLTQPSVLTSPGVIHYSFDRHLMTVANRRQAPKNINSPSYLYGRPSAGIDERIRLVGRIVDSASRPVPGVTITALEESKGSIYAALSDAEGFYFFLDLPPGTYTLTTRKAAYRDEEVVNVTIYPAPERVNRDIILTESQIGPATPPRDQPGNIYNNGPLILPFNTARSGNFNDQQINALPSGAATDMRTFDDFAFLVPGVAPPPYTPGTRGPGIGFGIGSSGKFSVNGMRARSNNFSVDGSDDNDPDVGVRRQGFLALVPQSIESINELQIVTLLWDAELGRNSGSQVNAVSKYGGNDYRGQIYGFITDSRLSARNFFDYSGGVSRGKDPFTRTQAGLVLEGPFARNRSHFFGSFEHQSINAATEQHFATPTIPERDFRIFLKSVLGDKPDQFGILKPLPEFTSNAFFLTDQPATPLGLVLLSFYPAPNNPGGPYGANTYTEVLPANGEGVVSSFKVTHQFKQSMTLNARYNFTNDNRQLPAVNRAIRSALGSHGRTQNLSLVFDSERRQSTFYQTRFSYGRTHLDFSEQPGSPFVFGGFQSFAVDTASGPVTTLGGTGPIGELRIEPFSSVGIDPVNFPQERVNNTFQFSETVSRRLQGHQIKFGGDIHRLQFNSQQDRLYRGRVMMADSTVVFGTLDQAGPFAPFTFKPGPGDHSFLLPGVQLASLGLASTAVQTIVPGLPDSTIGLRFTEYSFFFNDSWQVSETFVLDCGLRYEYKTVPNEVNGRIEGALRLNGLPEFGRSQFDSPDRMKAFNAAVEAYKQIVDGRTSIYQPDRNNFGPHVGFAWRPFADRPMMARGGYGIYYDTILGAVISQSRNIFPSEFPINVSADFLPNIFFLNIPSQLGFFGDPQNPIRLVSPGTLNQFDGRPEDRAALIGEIFSKRLGSLAFTLPDKNLRTPYAQHWHLTLESEFLGSYLVSAAYVGTKGTKLTRLVTPNFGPNFTPVISVALGQSAGDRSFPFPFPLVAPEFTKSMPSVRPISALGAFQIFENSANSSYHALQIEVRKRYVSGYTLTSAYTWSHGIDDVSDIFPTAGADMLPEDSLDLRLDRADASYDIRHHFTSSLIWDLPLYRNGKTGRAASWLGEWQLASVFQAYTGQPFTLNLPIDANLDGNLTDRPSTTEGLVFFDGHSPRKLAISPGRKLTDFFVVGRNGLVGRNTIRSDSFISLDLALTKRFQFAENHKLDFRAEFFNAFNRANFGTPIRTMGSPGFGSAVETVNPARRIQFALKYSF